jgi:hypothetical protein
MGQQLYHDMVKMILHVGWVAGYTRKTRTEGISVKVVTRTEGISVKATARTEGLYVALMIRTQGISVK